MTAKKLNLNLALILCFKSRYELLRSHQVCGCESPLVAFSSGSVYPAMGLCFPSIQQENEK